MVPRDFYFEVAWACSFNIFSFLHLSVMRTSTTEKGLVPTSALPVKIPEAGNHQHRGINQKYQNEHFTI